MKETVLITGAAGGIGSEAARLFAKSGWNVVLNYNSSEKAARTLEAELKNCGCEALAIRADVAEREQVDAMFDAAEKRFGRVSALVNNAGIAQQKLFTDITQEDYDAVFDTNVRGVFNCCRRAVGSMIHFKSGSIVNVSSMWGVCGASCEVLYSASKAAVIGMTKALAKELGPSGIRVNCIAPGVIDTKMNKALDEQTIRELEEETPLCRIGTPAEVAELILFLSGGKAGFITGQVIGVDGGFI